MIYIFLPLLVHNMLLKPQLSSGLQWLSEMNVDTDTSKANRKTSIIGTIGRYMLYITILAHKQIIHHVCIGPKTNSVEIITQLRNAGLNVVRMNFSHGSYEVGKNTKQRLLSLNVDSFLVSPICH